MTMITCNIRETDDCWIGCTCDPLLYLAGQVPCWNISARCRQAMSTFVGVAIKCHFFCCNCTRIAVSRACDEVMHDVNVAAYHSSSPVPSGRQASPAIAESEHAEAAHLRNVTMLLFERTPFISKCSMLHAASVGVRCFREHCRTRS